jgi:transposase
VPARHGARGEVDAGEFVKAFNIGNKNDAADARAIWLAVQQPGKAVAVKSEAQQAVLALHRMRQELVKTRTMQINGLRGLLAEYGEVMGKSRRALEETLAQVLARLAQRLPAMLIETLREQWMRLSALDEQIARIEQRLQTWMKQDQSSKAIAAIPGVGVLTATAAVATMGEAASFRSGREFAAWLGLVPAQTGSGGKIRLKGISKRGDTYLRTLLVHGARSVLLHAKDPGPWIEQMLRRRPKNVVIVALANKLARTIWAVLAHGQPYQKDKVHSIGSARAAA